MNGRCTVQRIRIKINDNNEKGMNKYTRDYIIQRKHNSTNFSNLDDTERISLYLRCMLYN